VTLTSHLFLPRQVAIFRLVIGEVKRSPELADAFMEVMLGRGANDLERRLAEEIARGRLALSDATEAAHMLFGMTMGAPHMLLLLGIHGPPSSAELEGRAAEAVEVFLRGALREPPLRQDPRA